MRNTPKARLVFLIAILIPNFSVGIGYDFSKCAIVFNAMNGRLSALADDPDSFLPQSGEEKQEWKNRQARLAVIRVMERNRVQGALGLLARFQDSYQSSLKGWLARAADPTSKERGMASLKKDLDIDGSKTVERLLRALESGNIREQELTSAIRAVALEEAALEVEAEINPLDSFFKAAGGKELVFANVLHRLGGEVDIPKPKFQSKEANLLEALSQTPTLQEIIPVNRSAMDRLRNRLLDAAKTASGPQKRELLLNADEIQDEETRRILRSFGAITDAGVLSHLRERTFERLVGETPLSQSLDTVPKERVREIYIQELAQLELEFGEEVGKLPARKRERAAETLRAGGISETVLADESTRNKYLKAAKRLLASKRLSPFFQEDLQRHVKFIEDFNLPVDYFSVHYLVDVLSMRMNARGGSR